MNAIALLEPAAEAPARVTESSCRDCGVALHDGEEFRCEGCADLVMHNGECRDCGQVLKDADLHRGTCTDCLS